MEEVRRLLTNFDFLLNDKQFETFSGVAIAAEKTLHIDLSTSIINCRRAMEMAVKWMYSVDGALVMPWQDNLVSLMNTEEFREIISDDLWTRMDFIRKVGNNAAHTGKKVTYEQAELCLENLYIFLDFIAYCYGDNYVETKYDKTLLELTVEEALDFVSDNEIDILALIEENKSLKAELTARREEQQQTYVPKPLDISE